MKSNKSQRDKNKAKTIIILHNYEQQERKAGGTSGMH